MSEPAPVNAVSAPDAAEAAGGAPLLPRRTAAGVRALIFVIALSDLALFYSRGLTNLYGDGVAHVEGARRLLDSLTPGYAEIGSVWLPLFHLLAAPLALNDSLWRSGLAGSLVSCAAFAVTAWFLFRLSFEINRSLAAAAVALAGFLVCPNMAFLATTPLTEPLAMLWMVLAVLFLFRFERSGRTRSLVGSGVAAFFGTLTRYDGWYLLPCAAFYLLVGRAPGNESWRSRIRNTALFSAIAGAGPLLWLLHNAYRFGNPLEFYNGRFSAQAIYAHQLATTAFPYPTDGNLLLSARYYLEDLKLVIGVWPLGLAALGLIVWAAVRSEIWWRAPALLLLVPFPFYLHSLAYAAVPLYVPTLFPHTYYNLRYGLEMLPAVAILPSFLLGARLPGNVRVAAAGFLLVILTTQAAVQFSGGVRELPVVKEGILNTPCASKRSQAVSTFLKSRYDGGTVLMAAGRWPCLMPEVGIPFRKTLTETNREYWGKLRSRPEKWAEWIVRSQGDAVDELMSAHAQAFAAFDALEQVSIPPEGSVTIYRRRRP